MEVSGEYTFDAPQEEVWAALRDPDVLGSVMPGGQGFEEVGENEYEGAMNVRVGPVQGNFRGKIRLSDIQEPTSYHITVDGRGAPGFVKGEGSLELEGRGDQTHMTYAGEAQVGGRIASLGQRLLDTSARSLIRQSLESLNAYLVAQEVEEEVEEVEEVAAEARAGAEAGAVQTPAEETPETKTAPKKKAPAAYTPPSQTEMAINVAKDVVAEYVPAESGPALVAVTFFVLGFLAGLLVNRR